MCVNVHVCTYVQTHMHRRDVNCKQVSNHKSNVEKTQFAIPFSMATALGLAGNPTPPSPIALALSLARARTLYIHKAETTKIDTQR